MNACCRFLDELGRNGECSAEFLMLYKRLIMPGHWRYYLALKGVLMHIGTLITREINEIAALEETTLSSELSQGYALKSLTGRYPSIPFLMVCVSFYHLQNFLPVLLSWTTFGNTSRVDCWVPPFSMAT